MIDELRKCYKCGYETTEVVRQCPKCGRRVLSTKQVRRLGWLQLLLGLFLSAFMGTIALSLAPIMLHPGRGFTGTPQQALLILGLFGLVIVFGLSSIANGLWQIITGRRNKWILYLSFVLFALLLFVAWSVRNNLQS